MAIALQPNTAIDYIFLLKILVNAAIGLVIEIILPLRHTWLIARITLRKFRACFDEEPSHDLSVVSIGANLPNKDAYLGKLLEEIRAPFNYITMAAGSTTHSPENILIESLLPARTIAFLWLSLPLRAPWLLFQLLCCTRKLKNIHEKIVFICFGSMEITAGRVLGQQIAVAAISHHLNQGKTRTLLFPMEARNWEKCIVAAAKSAQVHTIGYVHCALTPRHFGLRDNCFLSEIETPDRIIAPSEMAYNIIRTQYGDRTAKGYFLRGLNSPPRLTSSKKNYLLFALIGDMSESEKIIEAVASLRNLLKQHLVIRINPNTASFPHLKSSVTFHGLSLYDPIAMGLPEVCFFRSSSVAIEYLRQNVKPVYLAIDEPISNNVFELDNKFGITSVKVDGTFAQAMTQLVAEDHYVRGSEIAAYYLDADFTPSDLLNLIYLPKV
ncbi:hypothetical protein [Rhodoferax sp. TS-BS-61-7]|uniref:hypothetical protein n=1 Tax=Rhodoferax sp. TS-BS-61-7 TaxID=2094194 RepID=UPI0011B0F05E|nr:hypothetical protein [Rhodoferax sp. TS-BS-61-7]